MSRVYIVAACICVALTWTHCGLAVDSTWDVDSHGDWSHASNWTNGVPQVAGDIARLTYDITQNITVSLDMNLSLDELHVHDDSHNYSVANTGSYVVTFVGTTPGIYSSGSARSYVMASSVRLDSNSLSRPLRLDVASENRVSLSDIQLEANVAAGINKTGQGHLQLIGNNAYAGPTTVRAGVLGISQDSSLGTTAAGTTVMANAALELAPNLTIAERLDVSGIGPDGLGVLRLPEGNATCTGRVKMIDNSTFFVGEGTLNISGQVTQTFPSPPTRSLVKEGAGILELSANNNNYLGSTILRDGVLRARDGFGLPTASTLYLDGGTYEGNGNFTRGLGANPNEFRYFNTPGGFSAHGGKFTVNVGGSAATLTWGQTHFVQDGQQLPFGSSFANSEIEFRNPINLAGRNRMVYVSDNADTSNDFANLTGRLSNGTLTKSGAGELWLSGDNTLGVLNVDQGMLQQNHANALGTGGQYLNVRGGTLDINGYTTWLRNVTLLDGTIQDTAGGGLLLGTGYTVEQGEIRVPIGQGLTFTVPLRKREPGTVLLLPPTANTYNGPTTIEEGALAARDGLGLPGSTELRLDGGVLEDGGASFTRSLGGGSGQVTWISDGGFSASGGQFNVNLGGASQQLAWGQPSFVGDGNTLLFGSMTFDDVVNFQNPIDLGGDVRTMDVARGTSGFAKARMSGALSGEGGGLLKVGEGQLELSVANSFSGPTTVADGYLTITDPDALGTAAMGTTVDAGGTLAMAGVMVTAEPLSLAGFGQDDVGGALQAVGINNRWDGPITLAQPASIGVLLETGELTTSLPIDDLGAGHALDKVGDGKLIWEQAANAYSGRTNVFGGTLEKSGDPDFVPASDVLSDTAPLGVANQGIFNLNGFDETVGGLQGGLTLPSPVFPLIAFGDSRPGGRRGTLTVVTAAGETYDFLGHLGYRPGLPGPGARGELTVTGTGTQRLLLPNTINGFLKINGGATVALAELGDLSLIAEVEASSQGRFLLDNSGTNNTNRVNSIAGIVLIGGRFEHDGKVDGVSSETMGDLRIFSSVPGVGSHANFQTDFGGTAGSSDLDFVQLGRGDYATIAFQGNLLGTSQNKVQFTTPPLLTNGILPYATINGEVATYDLTVGITVYIDDAFVNDTSTAAATDNVKLTSNAALLASKEFNALHMGSTPGYDLDVGDHTLTLGSGALFVPAGSTSELNEASSGVLTAVGLELFAHVGGTLKVYPDIVGDLTIIKVGSGTMELHGTANCVGPLRIEEGIVKLGPTAAIENDIIGVSPGATFDVRDAGGFVVADGQRLQGGGTVLGGVTVDGSLALPAAANPLQLQTLNLTSFSELVVDIAGTRPDQFGQLAVSGSASLQGQLTLSLLDPSILAFGDEFPIVVTLGAGTFSGQFDTISGVTFAPDRSLAVIYEVDQVVVTVALPGDADLNGIVDGSDFGIWNTNKFGFGTSWATGDFNGDGRTDGSDFGIWNANKFTTVDRASVPEPLGTHLSAYLLCMWALRRTAQSRRRLMAQKTRRATRLQR